MQPITFTGNDTFLLSDVPFPEGLASDTAVSITFPNPISDTIVGYDGSIGAGLLLNGKKAEIVFRVFAGSPLANEFIGLQRNWINDPTSLGNSTFSATKSTDNEGGTYTMFFDAFFPNVLSGFQSSNSNVKDAIELEFKFVGVYNITKS
jgi:hypothetical protein